MANPNLHNRMASGLSPKPDITVDKWVGCINLNCIHLSWEASILRISLWESWVAFYLFAFLVLSVTWFVQMPRHDVSHLFVWMFSRSFAVFELKLRFGVSPDVNWSQAISTQLYSFSRSVLTSLVSVFMCVFRQTKQRRFNSFNCLMSV